jgi:putative aldouronate transport system permease protein
LVVRNTVVLRLWQLAIGFPAPIILALLLNELRTIRFKRIVQTSSYLPHFISLVVVSGMVISFLASDGPINSLIKTLGGQPIPFMQLPEWFASIFTFSGIWQHAGWASVIYLAALTSISMDLIEAAVIDGAGRWQRLLHITLPGIAPVVTIMFLLRIGQLLTVDYQMILLLYSPAIYEKADVLGTYIYRRGIVGADFSFATAVGLFQAAVGLVFIVGANKIAKRVGDNRVHPYHSAAFGHWVTSVRPCRFGATARPCRYAHITVSVQIQSGRQDHIPNDVRMVCLPRRALGGVHGDIIIAIEAGA